MRGTYNRPCPLSRQPAQASRREDSLPQPPYVVLDSAPIHGVPVEDIALRSVHRRRCPTCPSVPASPISCSSQAHLTHVSSLSGRATRPYPTSYAATIRRRSRSRGSRFPVAFRLSAFASWVILRPLGSCAFLTVGLPAIDPPDPNGVVVLRMSKTRPGRAPPLPRGRWCAPGRRLSSGRHPPLSCGQSLRPRWNIPSAGVTFTRRHRGFTHVRPSPQDGWLPPRSREASPLPAGLLLARGPRMEREPLRLLPRASHPAVTRDARRGGDRPSRTGPSTTPSTSVEPPTVPPTFTHAPSCRTQP